MPDVAIYFYRSGHDAVAHYMARGTNAEFAAVDLCQYDLIWKGQAPAAWEGGNGPLEICEQLFRVTNAEQFPGGFRLPDGQRITYPAQRSHSSMSVGDVVVVDGVAFVCLPIGFKRVMTK